MADAVRLYASYMLNLLLLKGQRSVQHLDRIKNVEIPLKMFIHFVCFVQNKKSIKGNMMLNFLMYL